MSEKTGMKSIMPSGKEIGFMVFKGFGTFLLVSGMVGITFILGPLNHIIQDLDLSYTLVFGNKASAFFSCFGLCVIGGAVEFFADRGIKALEKQQ